MDALHLETLTRLVHHHDDRLRQIEEKMATTDEIITRLNAATNTIAAKLQELRDQVSGLDPAIAAKFEPLVAQLEAMGSDPTDPIPAEPEPQPS